MSMRIGSPTIYTGLDATLAYQQQKLRKTQEGAILEQHKEVNRHQVRQQLDANLNTAPTLENNPLPATQRVNPVSAIDISLGLASSTIGGTINTFA